MTNPPQEADLTPAPCCRDFRAVLSQELAQLAVRRRRAGIEAGDPMEVAVEDRGQQELKAEGTARRSGLALSGGGIRSASFNLGFLQALYCRGVLRQVDYLSTVSGGGYVGSYMTSLAAHPQSQLKWDESQGREDTDPGRGSGEYSIVPSRNGRQPAMVRRLIGGGNSLRRPLRFFNRYVFGLIAFNLVVLSSIACGAAALAWAFRWVDHEEFMVWSDAVGFRGDIRRSLLPAVGFGLLWLLTWAGRVSAERIQGSAGRGARVLRQLNRLLFFGMILSSLLALIALLATGDISLGGADDSRKTKSLVHKVVESLTVILLVFQVLALLPVFGLNRLLRSGTHPRNAFDSLLFSAVGVSIWLGVPLLFFGVFVQEDISGTVSTPSAVQFGPADSKSPYLLSRLHIADQREFWSTVREQASHPDVARRDVAPVDLVYEPSHRLWAATGGTGGVADTLIRRQAEYDEGQNRTWFYERPWRARHLAALRRGRDRLADEAVDLVNAKLLSDPYFYTAFLPFRDLTESKVPVPTTADVERIRELTARAEGLAAELADLPDGPLPTRDDPERAAALRNLAAAKPEWLRRLRDVQSLNRQLAEAYYGPRIRPASTVFALNVLAADQAVRLRWAGALFVVFLLSSLLIPLNATSLHGFYRNRLSDLWIVEPPDSKRPVHLSDLLEGGRWKTGAPYLLAHATFHALPRPTLTRWLGSVVFGSGRSVGDGGTKAGDDRVAEADDLPRLPFLFSACYCGAEPLGFAETARYERRGLDLADVMALSGSAVNPMMTANFSLRVMLALSNLRLGQWEPNPAHLRGPLLFPAALWRLGSWLFVPPTNRRYLFLSDGGHYENLGLEALLLRRTRVIICVDAGHDPEGRFIDLLKVIRRSRAMHGISIGDPAEQVSVLHDRHLMGLTGRLASAHFCLAHIRYPSAEDGDVVNQELLKETGEEITEGWLIYVKPSFTGDEGAELVGYREENPLFPYDPTIDQFYDQRQFESYRALGQHIGERIVEEVLCPPDAPSKHLPWLADWEPPDQWGDRPRAGSQAAGSLAGQPGQYVELFADLKLANAERFRVALSGSLEARWLAAKAVKEAVTEGDELSVEGNGRAARVASMLLKALNEALHEEQTSWRDPHLVAELVEVIGGFRRHADEVRRYLVEYDPDKWSDPVARRTLEQVRSRFGVSKRSF